MMATTPRSLSNRLRQHSRRSGFAVGVSMALAIAICIAGFVAIYVQLQPYISDFVTQDPPEEEARVAAAPDPTEPPADDDEEEPAPTEEPSEDEEAAASDEDEAPPEEDEEEPEPTEDSDDFNPDFQLLGDGGSVNLRSGPSVATDVVIVVGPEQPLQFLDEAVVSDNPDRDQLSQGQEWWQFRTENGEEGWIREIDVEPFEE